MVLDAVYRTDKESSHRRKEMAAMIHRITRLVATIVGLSLGLGIASAQPKPSTPAPAPANDTAARADAPRESTWPYAVDSGDTKILVYPPQLQSWNGSELDATAAASVTVGEKGTPTFGILDISARTLVDKGSRLVTLDDYKVVKADFPSAQDKSPAWTKALQDDAKGKSRTIALDRLEASLEIAASQDSSRGAAPIRNDVPTVILSTKPAMLVYVDGAPVFRALEKTNYQRVVNTRPLLVKSAQGDLYLHVFDGWLTAKAIDGPWAVATKPPSDLTNVLDAAKATRQVDLLTGQTSADEPPPTLAKGPVPTIYVATMPTELVVTDGVPNWVPIPGTQLLFADNTTGHLFKLVSDQYTYALLSGRWFRTRNETQGPWEFVPSDKLAKDFAQIPDDSPKENVKAAVAGTPQAREAAIAATVPSTAAVDAKKAKLTSPTFDGAPKLEPIAGTTLHYVANSPTPIIQIDANTFYAVENGVWFLATNVKGPWIAATLVPPAIYTIPPSSPLYYVTFVKIYGMSGDTVSEGYTPGYQGTYVDPATQVVVYGTGYPYTPWVGTYWYGAPITYGTGAAVCYTPWTGWAVAFGIGWFWGAATIAVGWGWGAHPWWGPWGWGWSWGPPVYPVYGPWRGAAVGPGGAVAWGPGGWAGTTGNVYSRWGDVGAVTRTSQGYNAWTGNRWANQVGMAYNSRTGVLAAGQRGAVANVYSGDYAAGARGAATGPGGVAVAGRAGTAGNVYNGRQVTAGQGIVYDKNTGQATTGGFIKGDNGGAARIGDDVYAGHDGNVYRRTDDGTWQQHTDNGWQNTNAQRPDNLARDSTARDFGQQRFDAYSNSTQQMNRSFGGGGFSGGGGFRRR
jgi:hypothetical protein